MGRMKDVHAVAMFFYCEWVGGIVRVDIDRVWTSGYSDPCGRYESEALAEFKCDCGRWHTVSLKPPYGRVK